MSAGNKRKNLIKLARKLSIEAAVLPSSRAHDARSLCTAGGSARSSTGRRGIIRRFVKREGCVLSGLFGAFHLSCKGARGAWAAQLGPTDAGARTGASDVNMDWQFGLFRGSARGVGCQTRPNRRRRENGSQRRKYGLAIWSFPSSAAWVYQHRGALRGTPKSACPQPEPNATELPRCAPISARAAQRRRRRRRWRGGEGARRPGPEGQVLRHVLWHVLRSALSLRAAATRTRTNTSHMAQKPVLRGEVGCACVAREVSVERGGMGERGCARRFDGWVWV